MLERKTQSDAILKVGRSGRFIWDCILGVRKKAPGTVASFGLSAGSHLGARDPHPDVASPGPGLLLPPFRNRTADTSEAIGQLRQLLDLFCRCILQGHWGQKERVQARGKHSGSVFAHTGAPFNEVLMGRWRDQKMQGAKRRTGRCLASKPAQMHLSGLRSSLHQGFRVG